MLLEVYFTCEGVAHTARDVTLERANGMTFALQRLDLKLREKAVATKTAVCGYANYIHRREALPGEQAFEDCGIPGYSGRWRRDAAQHV
ncbi:hypothetical protein HPB50_017170 [Hyalomma asiaticum]|uniref:Uncharacterized protein n=1 Tax=Hyalomma asiaticum TaxID=266040 RepID=A0ACB7RP56_HYAAI|nr:hypothetical protein HPB50_017170 [Hyalomma asiaticum]